MINTKIKEHFFAVCIQNDGFPASLEKMKIYEIIPDEIARKHNQYRVVDESGEDYLYPDELFVVIDLPEAVEKAVQG
ncbi:hypothetical protein [Geoalkalibacter subterraneus]|uniref:Uncharacterized protein n=1 Tax=Geoalkalibacter subterraneus TaxID=483547 RepID=A0A0B5FSB9_9BACT|nr:hypothetical protein [Geoalkalibacter subterraneus]AJF06501.1 hypothetical protein GSUB_08010 [Geoalkalibacter subterraneus]